MGRIEVRICGLGGQGVVLAGQILGRAAVIDGMNVVQTQSYGAEARGSAAKSEVIVSDKQIGFPHVRKCDVLVALSQSALDAHCKDLKESGILLVDGDLVSRVPERIDQVYKLPASRVAETRFKSRMYANVVMLGALTIIAGIASKKAMKEAIEASVKRETQEANLQAFEAGLDLQA
ncbi:MAG: 2-oxoacid:acceptor oxidoreductase family protein [Candidatus Bathyarchaeota archaeon]|jgi:2-oxoglutarate ferredoxin oxidoreductase subunit gamma|nr:MAG: 2-oxoacid:acceptor oxidoreductase family protein [Candidatus Bathyarchaeota archaeon]